MCVYSRKELGLRAGVHEATRPGHGSSCIATVPLTCIVAPHIHAGIMRPARQERETERERDRETETERERQRETERQRERERERDRDRDRQRQTDRLGFQRAQVSPNTNMSGAKETSPRAAWMRALA